MPFAYGDGELNPAFMGGDDPSVRLSPSAGARSHLIAGRDPPVILPFELHQSVKKVVQRQEVQEILPMDHKLLIEVEESLGSVAKEVDCLESRDRGH